MSSEIESEVVGRKREASPVEKAKKLKTISDQNNGSCDHPDLISATFEHTSSTTGTNNGNGTHTNSVRVAC
jgi:hypothetical protein